MKSFIVILLGICLSILGTQIPCAKAFDSNQFSLCCSKTWYIDSNFSEYQKKLIKESIKEWAIATSNVDRWHVIDDEQSADVKIYFNNIDTPHEKNFYFTAITWPEMKKINVYLKNFNQIQINDYDWFFRKNILHEIGHLIGFSKHEKNTIMDINFGKLHIKDCIDIETANTLSQIKNHRIKSTC